MPTVVHHSMLPLPGTTSVPDWVHLLPSGEFGGRDGRGPYRLRDAAAVITTSMAMNDGRLPIDENHATDHAMKTGQAAPAQGWVVELQSREDGIWGRVEWTPSGRALLEAKAYRGISPVYGHDKDDGEVLYLLRAALTNTANLPQLATLHSQQESEMDLNALREALGLPATADDAAILAAANASRAAVVAHSQTMARIATAAGVTEANAGADQIVTALQSRTGERELSQTVVSLQTQLTTLQQTHARDTATRVVDAAIAAGKPIRPLRERLIARHMQDPAGVDEELAAYPSINAGGLGGRTPPAASGDSALGEADNQVIALMNLDPDAYKKQLGKTAEAR